MQIYFKYLCDLMQHAKLRIRS